MVSDTRQRLANAIQHSDDPVEIMDLRRHNAELAEDAQSYAAPEGFDVRVTNAALGSA